jgi:hypothetical protein
VVSWTTHNLLSRDWGRWVEYHGTQAVMNGALSEVLHGLGFDDLDDGVRRLAGCPHQVVPNPYHDA